jgi:hypothetical protein
MSYLDPPRLTFCGKFLANVPTLNNFPPYFEKDYPYFGASAGDWNTNGDCTFRIFDCQVKSVTDVNGRVRTDEAADGIVGAAVTTEAPGNRAKSEDADAQPPSSAKIVDLDVDQRRVTELYGVQIVIALKSGGTLSGDLLPCNMRDFWGTNAATSSTGAAPQSGVFQSVLHKLQWPQRVGRSPFLKSVSSLSERNGGRLSIKLILDNFSILAADPTMNLVGRVVGIIGPYFPGEPRQFVAARRLTKTFASPAAAMDLPPIFQGNENGKDIYELVSLGDAFWPAPCKIDPRRKKLIVDLGNSVMFKDVADESLVPKVYAAIMPSEAEYQAGKLQPKVLGPPLDTSKLAYETAGRIGEVDLSDDDITRLKDHRICVLPPDEPDEAHPNGPPKNPWPVLAEHAEGKFADVDSWVLRLNPGESGSVELYARKFGEPLAGERLAFAPVDFPCTYVTINRPHGVLAGRFPRTVVTNKQGKATATFRARRGPIKGLPPARVPIFSQVYQLGDVTGWQSWGQVGPPVPPYLLAAQNYPVDLKAAIVSVLVFNTGRRIRKPKWDDVKDVFTQYSRLFPGMNKLLDLSSEQMVTLYAREIDKALRRPISDPLHMPATRDLSGYHRQLMLDFLRQLF